MKTTQEHGIIEYFYNPLMFTMREKQFFIFFLFTNGWVALHDESIKI